MKASPFAEFDIDTNQRHRDLVARVRDFARQRPLQGLASSSDDEELRREPLPWETPDSSDIVAPDDDRES